MSVPNLYRIFYALTGHALKEYVRKRRISEAAALLRETDRAVVDIAYDSGFDSYRAFAGAFKKLTGLTPGMYREASHYYSFEPIDVTEAVSYMEDRELSERYPDVKVIRQRPQRMLAYRHEADCAEGIEDAAFRAFYRLLEQAGAEPEQRRIFGYNLDPAEESPSHGYLMMTAAEGLDAEALAGESGNTDGGGARLHVLYDEGGLCAVLRTVGNSPETIYGAWNRLLAEWLPRSTFVLGDRVFLEEHVHRQGTVFRMKLYLPVVRKQEQEPIEVVTLQSCAVTAVRAYGRDSYERADAALTQWLDNHWTGPDHSGPCTLTMSCNYGQTEEDDMWHEFGIDCGAALVEGHIPVGTEAVQRIYEGGEYACMTTGAYGSMTGVLDQIYRWLGNSGKYMPDENRQWYASYLPAAAGGLDSAVKVTCCVPVRQAAAARP